MATPPPQNQHHRRSGGRDPTRTPHPVAESRCDGVKFRAVPCVHGWNLPTITLLYSNMASPFVFIINHGKTMINKQWLNRNRSIRKPFIARDGCAHNCWSQQTSHNYSVTDSIRKKGTPPILGAHGCTHFSNRKKTWKKTLELFLPELCYLGDMNVAPTQSQWWRCSPMIPTTVLWHIWWRFFRLGRNSSHIPIDIIAIWLHILFTML